MYGISVTFHQFFLTLKICYVKTKKFSIKSWTRWTYIYVANTQAKEFKRKKEFLKTLLDVAGGPFCLSLGSSGKT